MMFGSHWSACSFLSPKLGLYKFVISLHTQESLSLSITEYFQKLKQLVDTLAAVHRPLDDFEVNSYLLASLSSDYESMVASIQILAAPMSLDELYGH